MLMMEVRQKHSETFVNSCKKCVENITRQVAGCGTKLLDFLR